MGEKPPLTLTEFAAMCRENLDTADADAAIALVNGDANPHPFAISWQSKETILRNTITRFRAQRQGVDPSLYLRSVAETDLRAEAAVTAAFQSRDPLQREYQLDTLRWTLVEELQGYDPLSISVVFAYAVKLRLCTTWAQRTADAGNAACATLTDIPITL